MDDNCIFCKLANGVIPVEKAYEDDDIAVIFDAGPATKGHMLILPKNHYKNISEVPQELAGKMLAMGAKLGEAARGAFKADGYNILVNTDEAAGQTVFHTHMHVIPRHTDDRAFKMWIPGEAEDVKGMAEAIKANLK